MKIEYLFCFFPTLFFGWNFGISLIWNTNVLVQNFIWADLLKHDKVLSKKPPAPHLRDVPDYLLDQKTKEACKMVKLARAAMGKNNPGRCRKPNKKSRKDGDPLKSFSAEVNTCLSFCYLFTNLLWDLNMFYFETRGSSDTNTVR